MSRMAGVEGVGGQCWGAAGAILRRSRDTQSCLDGVGTIACRSVRSISWSTTGSKLLGPVLPVTSWSSLACYVVATFPNRLGGDVALVIAISGTAVTPLMFR